MGCLSVTPVGCNSNPNCPDQSGCMPGKCPDFQIKRHDTMPAFKVSITDDDDNPMDLTGLVLEANMWINTKLKATIQDSDTELQFADNIGFDHILPNDIIVTDRVRSPEYMQITGFDETNKIVSVTRAYNDTTADTWNKGTKLKIFRFMNSPAATEMIYNDVMQVDGTTLTNQLTDSFMMYEWQPADTCVPGCFNLEFKLLSMQTGSASSSSVTPSICSIGVGVEWVRRYPVCGDYIIKIHNSPTAEVV